MSNFNLTTGQHLTMPRFSCLLQSRRTTNSSSLESSRERNFQRWIHSVLLTLTSKLHFSAKLWKQKSSPKKTSNVSGIKKCGFQSSGLSHRTDLFSDFTTTTRQVTNSSPQWCSRSRKLFSKDRRESLPGLTSTVVQTAIQAQPASRWTSTQSKPLSGKVVS